LFGTDGIRGRVNEFPITAEVALRVGKAVARVLRSSGPNRNRVLVGKDTRISGYMLETALTSGLVASGMDVLLVGPLPTPAVAHLTTSMGCVAGIMLTASHNPFEDNGLKIFGPDGYKLNDDLEDAIERYILDPSPPETHVEPLHIGKATRIDDARGRYIEFAKYTADNISLRGLKIVIDCGNGASYFVAPLIFRELGAEVITMATQPDGININDNCGALHPEHAAALVTQHQADLGISFDGDADRVIFTDAHGNVVSGDRIIALTALALQQRGELRGDTIAVTVMSNLGLHRAMTEHGITVVETAVGDRYVLEALAAGSHSLGGEQSGHVIMSDFGTTGDGVLTGLHLVAEMARTGKTVKELAGVMTVYPQILVNVRGVDHRAMHGNTVIETAVAEASLELADTGRVLLRPSGTEPMVRVMVEAADQATADRLAHALADVVKAELGT
jgi:phosphoglucosamine mutase